MDTPRITLLGPQRQPSVGEVAHQQGLTGARWALVCAGWREREDEDAWLRRELGHDALNLGLWSLMLQLWEADPELAAADHKRRRILREIQQLYTIAVEHCRDMLTRLRERTPRFPSVQADAIENVFEVMHDLDERHRVQVAEVNEEFYARYEPHHRDAVLEARHLVGNRIASCDAVLLAGGHVGALLETLHIFNVAPALAAPGEDDAAARPYRPILAYGGGAMALTERIYLFHDFAATAPPISELFMDGLGLTRGLVALPNAHERLAIRDRERMANLYRRVAPRLGLVLDEGARVRLTSTGTVPTGARVVSDTGRIVRHDRGTV